MDTNCRKRLHRWIKRFSLSDDIYTDCHITDFCNEIQRREWLKVSFSILDTSSTANSLMRRRACTITVQDI